MTLIVYSATEAKQNFAAMLDASARQPVVIRRHDRDVEANGLTEKILADLLARDD